MQNPFGSQQLPGSYRNLKERMYKKMSPDVNDQILGILKKAYEDALNAENVVLSRPERKRLFTQLSKQLLADVSKKLGDGNT